MLKIYLGNMENAIYHPPTYFDNRYQDEWITNELSIRMIKAVDKSDVSKFSSDTKSSIRTDFHKRTVRFCKDIDADGV